MTYKEAHKRTLQANVCYKDKGEAKQNDTPKDKNKNQTKVPKSSMVWSPNNNNTS